LKTPQMITGALLLVVLAIASAAAESLLELVPAGSWAISNPFNGDDRARRAGAKLYARECAACHGRDGSGFGKAPPLNLGAVYNAPPGAIFWVLRNGSLYHGMPSFAHLPEAQRWQIVTFLRTPGAFDSGKGSRETRHR
jgi:mono/diheme cytochrome c family protein